MLATISLTRRPIVPGKRSSFTFLATNASVIDPMIRASFSVFISCFGRDNAQNPCRGIWLEYSRCNDHMSSSFTHKHFVKELVEVGDSGQGSAGRFEHRCQAW